MCVVPFRKNITRTDGVGGSGGRGGGGLASYWKIKASTLLANDKGSHGPILFHHAILVLA